DVNASTPAAPDGIGLSSPIRETLFVATRSVELVFGPTDRCEPLAPLQQLPGQAVCPLWVVINGPDGPEIRLPLFPRRRTQVGHRAMSGSCQKRTRAPLHRKNYSITSSARASSVAGTL